MQPLGYLMIFILTTVRIDSLRTAHDDVDIRNEKNSTGASEEVIERFESIKKSPLDKRLYRGLKLCNNLSVLLISDPETDKGAACMTVGVGYIHDYDQVPGITHFLEHMLFLGSKKYPSENHFSKFIQDHAGSYNGQTEDGTQSFYFDISYSNLAEALDIFAQFFLDPLMDPSATTREVNAVDSEHAIYRSQDSWRFPYLMNSLSKPGHPYGRFSGGNRKCLETDPKARGIDVRTKLLELHATWYSSNIMYLVVLGKESLDDLEKMVIPLFKGIKNKNVPKMVYSEHPWGPEQLKNKIYGVPISDVRYMLLRFPLPSAINHYQTGPLEYINELIGHEGPGSLLAELKVRNWCDSLTTGYEDIPGFTFLDVQIDLTEEAMNHIDEIIKLVFQYIHLLKTRGVQEWFFREMQKTSETAFRFKDKESPIDYVPLVSFSMMNYPFEDVLSYGYHRNKWNATLIKEFLNYLIPSNMNILIVSKSFEKLPDLQIEPWHDTKYKVRKIPEDLIEEIWSATEPFDKFHLPPPNKFIVDKFDLYPLNEDKSKYPRLIHQSPISQIWFKQDDRFRIPKLHIKLNLFSPATCTNVNNTFLNQVFVQLFNKAFQIYGYAASRAGLEWRVNALRCGLQVHLSGYSEKTPALLENILSEMLKFELKEKKFEIAKEVRIRELQSFEADQPETQAQFYVSYLLDNTTYAVNELLAASQLLQEDDMKKFMNELFARVFVQGLIYGNCHSELAKDIINTIESSFKSVSVVLPNEIILPPVIKMDNKSEYLYEVIHKHHDSSGYSAYFQLGAAHPLLNAVIADLFFDIVGEKCFQVLRTEMQLGYVVQCKGILKNGVLGFVVNVQSEKHPLSVNSQVEIFLQNLRETLKDMTEMEFEMHKTSLKDFYLENVVGQDEQLCLYWDEIENRRYHFESQTVKAKLLAPLTKKDLIDFYEEHINAASNQRRKLNIHVVSNITNPAEPNDMPIKGSKIDNVTAFRSGSDFYPQPHSYMEVPPVGTKV